MAGSVSRRALLGGVAAGVAGTWPALTGTAAAAGTGVPAGIVGDARSFERRVDAVAGRLDRFLIDLRRDLHRHPEGPGQERRTAEVVARHLRRAGLQTTTGVGGHGVVAVLTGARPGRTVAYRADMDAVPPSGQVDGHSTVAHLCGHDLHTAVGVGVALVLARLRERLAGRVVFVFQPAEENLTGAAAMLADGVFDHVRPTEIHALHCGPFPVGQFIVTPGLGLPGQDRGVISLTGADAEARAQRLAADLAGLSTVSRPSGPADLEHMVDAVLTPDGPLARFVVLEARATGAQVQVSYRCWPVARHAEVRTAIRRLAHTAGGEAVFPADPFPAMLTPRRDGLALQRYLGGHRARPLQAALPFSGEDFALFLQRLPGTYTFLGVRAPRAGIETSFPHFGTFEPDERAIGHGVRAMAGWLALRARG